MPNTEWGKILREKGEGRSNQKGVLSGERKGTLGAGLRDSVEWGQTRRKDNEACANDIIKPSILYANLKN